MTERARTPLGWYAAWVGSATFAFFGLWYAAQVGVGYDSHAYWVAVQDMDRLYTAPALARDAFLYTPVFAEVIWPLGRLPWPAFWVVWSGLELAAFWWLLRPLPGRWFGPAMVAVLPEVVTGNIYAFMAVALVLGAGYGAPWSFLALTKLTPAAVGTAWFVGARRWRALVEAWLLTAVLITLSAVIFPRQWQAWIDFMRSGSGASASPLTALMIGAALAVAFVAGVTRRTWVLAIAAVLVSPTFGINTLTLLTAIPRLLANRTSCHSQK